MDLVQAIWWYQSSGWSWRIAAIDLARTIWSHHNLFGWSWGYCFCCQSCHEIDVGGFSWASSSLNLISAIQIAQAWSHQYVLMAVDQFSETHQTATAYNYSVPTFSSQAPQTVVRGQTFEFESLLFCSLQQGLWGCPLRFLHVVPLISLSTAHNLSVESDDWSRDLSWLSWWLFWFDHLLSTLISTATFQSLGARQSCLRARILHCSRLLPSSCQKLQSCFATFLNQTWSLCLSWRRVYRRWL